MNECVHYSKTMLHILLCIRTVEAVDFKEVVKEASAHTGVQEVVAGEKRLQSFQKSTLNLSKNQ